MKRRNDRSFPALVVFSTLLWAAFATAEVDVSTSHLVRLDVVPPAVHFLQSPTAGQYIAGEVLQIVWTVSEPHGSWSDEDHRARVKRGAEVLYEQTYPHMSGQYLWSWTVPELSLGDLYVEISVTDRYGNRSLLEGNRFTILSSTTGAETPPALAALDAAPNPFNPSTRIRLSMPADGPARLAAYDLQGRRVRTLLHGDVAAGVRTVDWDGRDDAGRALSAGTYLLRLDAAGTILNRKVVLLP